MSLLKMRNKITVSTLPLRLGLIGLQIDFEAAQTNESLAYDADET